MPGKKKILLPKKPVKPSPAENRPKPAPPQHSEAYQAALRDYTSAIELIGKGEYAKARELFRAIAVGHPDEPVIAERARTFTAVCERKLAPPRAEAGTAEELYSLGVVRTNEGKLGEAIQLLDRAVQQEPGSASFLYARASVRALQGNAETAAADLRKAVSLDPRFRYQATNDPDFEKIRDEAVFIDVIEPTPEGV